MARSTRAGGASFTEEEKADPTPPVRYGRAEIGFVDKPREDTSAETDGGGSTQSSPNEETSSDKPKQAPRNRARTTGSRSNQREPETDSSADSMDTDGPSKPAKQSAKGRTVPDDDEFDEFA